MYPTRNLYTDWARVPVLMTLGQAAMCLQLTPEALRRLCKAGEIPAAQYGKEWRICKDDLRAMIDRKRKGACDT